MRRRHRAFWRYVDRSIKLNCDSTDPDVAAPSWVRRGYNKYVSWHNRRVNHHYRDFCRQLATREDIFG